VEERDVRIGTDRVHNAWDNAIEPVLELAPGDRIELDLLDAGGGQLTADSTSADVAGLDFGRVNPVTGPIRVAGAQPGDAVTVRVAELAVGEWGWTAVIPGFGLLADDFPIPYLTISRISGGFVTLPFGPRVPVLPMIGTLGVALPEPGAHPLVPPSRFGGNLDIRQLTAGATVRLPVGVPGALLSAGDAHAAMGDGEICGTGVETSATAVLEIGLEPGAAPANPVLRTAPEAQRTGSALATTGVAPDLMVATRDAARALIDEVVRATGLAPVEAYLLASVAADLKISEVVDAPNWVVSCHLSTDLLD
jgi:acetamidase/formamidase